jgi:hypothetical protein
MRMAKTLKRYSVEGLKRLSVKSVASLDIKPSIVAGGYRFNASTF